MAAPQPSRSFRKGVQVHWGVAPIPRHAGQRGSSLAVPFLKAREIPRIPRPHGTGPFGHRILQDFTYCIPLQNRCPCRQPYRSSLRRVRNRFFAKKGVPHLPFFLRALCGQSFLFIFGVEGHHHLAHNAFTDHYSADDPFGTREAILNECLQPEAPFSGNSDITHHG